MKKPIFTIIFLILFIVLTGCSNTCDVNLGADKKTDEEMVNAHEFEKLYKEIEKKYKHVKKYEKNSAKYLINEYETSKGEVGYQIIKDNGSTLESVCIGIECENKNFIKEITTEISTSTLKL